MSPVDKTPPETETGSEKDKRSEKTDPGLKRFFWFRIPIYARIFGGMVAGLLIGILFGPQTPLLSKNRVTITAEQGGFFLSAPGAEKAKDLVPVETGTELEILEKREHDGKTWYRVHSACDETSSKSDPAEDEHPSRCSGWISSHDVSPPYSSKGQTVIAVMKPVGEIFLRLIKMLVVPLVFISLLVGVFSLSDLKKLGRMGGKTLLYYAVTTAVAILIGLTLANTIKPGRYVTEKQRDALVAGFEDEATERKEISLDKPPGVVNRIVEMIPENPVEAAARGDMLQIIFFALFFGIILRRVPGKGPEKLMDLCETVNKALVKAVIVVMETAPFGVMALLADVTGSSGLSVLLSLGAYCLVVLAGLSLHMFITYGIALKLFTSIRAWKFLKAARPAQLMGFSTSSSAATLPVTFRCAEETLGVSGPVTSFVLPLGATVNMDGTALYQAVAAVFVSQVFGLSLGLEAQLTILLTALLASIGAAAVPGAGIIMLAMVLESAGLPAAGVALVLGVDRLLDMFRTSVNVTGDLSAAVIVAATENELSIPEDPPK